MTQMILSMKQKWTHRHREHICSSQGEGSLGEGLSGNLGLADENSDIEWIENKGLQYSTGNYSQQPIINQFSCSVMSDSLRTRELQQTRPPCPSPTPGVYLNSFPLSRWCHPTISSSVTPVSFCFQSFPAWGSFPMNRLFPSGGQSIEVSASASVLPINIQGWSIDLAGWISLLPKGLSRVFSNITIQKHQFSGFQPSSWSNSYSYMTTGNTIVLTIWNFDGKGMSQLFNMLSRFVIAFLPRSKRLLISWL